MKTIGKLVLIGALSLVTITLMRYRHVDPCKALEREIVRDVEREMQSAADSLQEALAGLGDETSEAVAGAASAVENVAVGVAQGIARTKVEHMSRRECVAELWEMARSP
jgi:hypothetical protein